jgi:hypothetical protein
MGLGTTVTLMYWDDEANTLRPISTDFPLPTGQGTSIVLPEGETVDTSNLATSAKQDMQTDQLRQLAAVADGGSMTVDGAVEVSGTVNVGNAPLAVKLGSDPVSVTFPTTPSVNVTNEPTVKVAGTVPVSGSVSAVQSGEWTVTPSGTQSVSVANTAPIKTTIEGTPTVTVSNPISTVTVANPVDNVTIDGQVTIANPVTSVAVNNQRDTIAISNPSIPVTDNGGSLTVDGTVTTVPSGTQTVSGTVAATQSGTWTMTPSGTQTVSGTVAVGSPVLSASGSAMSSFRNAAVTNTPVQVRAGGGRTHMYHFGNPNSTIVFVHIYNALAANVTVGTTTPVASYMVAANSALDGFWPNSFNYGTGITVAVTTTAAGSTAPAAGTLVVLGYV